MIEAKESGQPSDRDVGINVVVHTPGPWEWREDSMYGGRSGLYDAGGEPVCVPNCSNDGDYGAAWFEGMLTDEDARLIAAAPDLLAACLAFLEADNQCGANLAFVMAQEAVQKAGIAPKENGGETCDMKHGPCSCGATH